MRVLGIHVNPTLWGLVWVHLAPPCNHPSLVRGAARLLYWFPAFHIPTFCRFPYKVLGMYHHKMPEGSMCEIAKLPWGLHAALGGSVSKCLSIACNRASE